MDLAGTIPPMVTPVSRQSGDLDIESVRSFTRFLVDGGVHGLFPAGSIGEFPSLTRAQRADLVETVVAAADGLPVIAGCGGTSIPEVRTFINDADDVGADAAVVVTPYYFDTTQEGLCSFYEQLADDTPIPIILYNIPQFTGQRLAKKSVIQLAEHPNVVGLKDSSRNLEYFANIGRQTPDSFNLLQGSPELAPASLDLGADGLIPGPTNVLPGILVDLYETHHSGDRERAVNFLRTVVLPLINTTRPLPSAPTWKYLLSKRGHNVGGPLPPLQPLTDAQQGWLDACHRNIVEPEIASR